MTNNQQLAEKMRMKKACMERIALSLGREISASEASDIFEGIRAGMVKVRQADPDKWATMTLQERADAAGKLYLFGLMKLRMSACGTGGRGRKGREGQNAGSG